MHQNKQFLDSPYLSSSYTFQIIQISTLVHRLQMRFWCQYAASTGLFRHKIIKVLAKETEYTIQTRHNTVKLTNDQPFLLQRCQKKPYEWDYYIVNIVPPFIKLPLTHLNRKLVDYSWTLKGFQKSVFGWFCCQID